MRRRAAKLFPLFSLLRLMVVALALQLSGSAPALASALTVVRAELGSEHACPCCAAMAARERAERVHERHAAVRAADADCCGHGNSGGACGDGCAGCSSTRDSKSFTSEEPLAVAWAEPVARVAARSPALPLPLFVHPPSIYRPPCA